MPTPLARAAYRYVMASGIPAELIEQNLLGYDPLSGDTGYESGWVFTSDDGDPYRSVKGTGRCAVVFYSFDEWSPPAIFRTAQYPRLRLSVFSDPDRDTDGNPTAYNAGDKAYAVWRALHPLFHDAANRIHAFDTLSVVNSVQGGGWSMMETPDQDGTVRGDCVYNVQLD